MFIFTVGICLLLSANALTLNMKSFAKEAVLQPFVERNALKIISGLHNFDKELVENVAWAAYKGGATHIDIACDPELVKIAKSVSNLPVCVSAVEPENFVHAVKAGADMVEIGNFDGFYEKGIEFTADDVIRMTEETRKLLPFVPLSVTIPHTLSLPDQIELAQRIEAAGADIIQTEGKVSANLPAGSVGTQELIGIAAPTLAAAHALSRAVSIPVMCASGLTDVTAPLAAAVGASGVGIGSMVNKLPSRQQMLLAVSALAGSMGLTNTNEGTEAIITLFEDEEESLARKTPSSFSAFKSRDFTNW